MGSSLQNSRFDGHDGVMCEDTFYESVGYMVIMALQFIFVIGLITLVGRIRGKNIPSAMVQAIMCDNQVDSTPPPARPGKKDNAHVV